MTATANRKMLCLAVLEGDEFARFALADLCEERGRGDLAARLRGGEALTVARLPGRRTSASVLLGADRMAEGAVFAPPAAE